MTPQDAITKAEQATAALRDVVREAHGLLQDVKDERRALAAERAAVQQLLDGIQDRAANAVSDAMGEAIKAGLEGYDKALQYAIDKATARIDRRFDTLASIMLGEEKPSQESIADQVRRWRAANIE